MGGVGFDSFFDKTTSLKPRLQHTNSSPNKLTHSRVFEYLGGDYTGLGGGGVDTGSSCAEEDNPVA
jgi:hypothetical protein